MSRGRYPAQSLKSGAAQQTHNQGLGVVVGGMRGHYDIVSAGARDFFKQPIALFTGFILHGRSGARDFDFYYRRRKTGGGGKFFHDGDVPRYFFARAKPVVKVHKFGGGEAEKRPIFMQQKRQSRGIRPAGSGHEYFRPARNQTLFFDDFGEGFFHHKKENWQGWGSNPRPTAYESAALPLSYPAN